MPSKKTEQQKAKAEKKNTFVSDFKKFLSRGNVMDLAVAVIIGAAFGKIVTSLVNDIIMPLVSLVLGGINFADLKWVIRSADEAAGVTETALGYGAFIQSAIDFIIIAFCIFIIIRLVGRAQQGLKEIGKGKCETTEETAPAAPQKPSQEQLLTEIRDLLKEQQAAGNERKDCEV